MKKGAILLIAIAALAALLTVAAASQTSNQTVKKPPVQESIAKVPPLALTLPDLKIVKIYFATFLDPNPNKIYKPITTDLKLGQKVFLVCDLTNAGMDSKGLWLLGFYIDDVMVWNNSWGDLGAGQNLRGVGVWTPNTEGIHTFRCFLDCNKQITESKEDNNQSEVLFKVVK